MGLVRAGIAGGPLERSRHRRVGLGLAGDAQRVQSVALALAAAPAPLSGACRAHIAHVMALTDQIHRGVPAETAGALDAPPDDRPEPQRPRLHRPVPVAGHPERRRAQRAATLVEHRRRHRALVRIGTEHVAVSTTARAPAAVLVASCPSRAPLRRKVRGPVDTSPLRRSTLLSSQTGPEGKSRRRHFGRRTPAPSNGGVRYR